MIIADTSGLYAGIDAAQSEHAASAVIMHEERLVVSPLVLTELDHLVRRDLGVAASMAVAAAINARVSAGQYKLAEIRPVDLIAAHEVRDRYRDLALDLTDAVGVVLADRHATDAVFTLDQRDFRVVVPITARFSTFRLLPMDRERPSSSASDR